MQNLKILNKKETKVILSTIKKQYGCDFDSDYVFLQNEKNKVFITNKDIDKIDFSKLRVNSMGLYIAEISNGVRLSIEGSELIGPLAKKNVIWLDEEGMKRWMKGEDLEIDGEYFGFPIVRYKDNFLGSGRYKEGKVLNYVNKIRRLNP